MPRAFAVDKGVVNVVPVFGRVAVKWKVCAWLASPSQRRPWRLEPSRGTAGTWLVHRDRGEVEAAALDTKDGNGGGGR